MKFIKKYGINILKNSSIFLFFFFSLVISYNIFFGDTIVNYGFSYAISRGEIPYNDFNLVIPLFSPFLYSVPLIFTKNIIIYYLFQSLLITILFKIIKKLLGNKVYLLLPIIFLGFPICLFSVFFPGYNFILLFLIIMIIYLEKEFNNKDYLIGLLIGLAIITKHTIGIFLILPSLLYLKNDYKKIIKRIVAISISVSIFLVYLFITNSFYNFINLCILGLFDFLKNNGVSNNLFLNIILILGLIYIFYRIIKNPKKIDNYYVLVSTLFIYPLVDSYHLAHFILLVLILILQDFKFTKVINNKSIIFCSVIFTVFLNICWLFITFSYDDFKFVNYKNYPLRLMNSKMRGEYREIDNYIKKTDKDVVLFSIGTENYFYKITNNLDITYFDLSNYGNYGYDSYNKMTKMFDSLDDTVILINKNTVKEKESRGQQFYKELAIYVIDKYDYLEDIGDFLVYYKK